MALSRISLIAVMSLALACAVLAWRRPLRRSAITPVDAGYRVNLNEAQTAELSLLPGIGPALAQRIDASRAADGPFQHIEDLTRVKGIGPATLARVRLYAVVDPPAGVASPAGVDPPASADQP